MSRTYDEFAALYDAAFSWDIAEEVDWLLERFGPGVRTLLEPACGPGRHFPDLMRRGVVPTGVDRSAAMLELARARMSAAGLPAPALVQADMADFHLGERFDGAYCPVNTLGLLTTEERVAAHLDCVADHLKTGAAYLVQMDLYDLRCHGLGAPDGHSGWEVERAEGRLRCTVTAVAWDAGRRVETDAMRFEILTGADAGAVFEDRDELLLWDWSSWSRLLAASPFRQVGAYDASRAGPRPPLEPGPGLEGKRLLWHELRLAKPAGAGWG